jgi:hypothetical protein
MRALLLAVLLALPFSASAAMAPAVKVGIDWEYRNFSATVEIFEVKGRPRLWETRSVKEMKDAPVAGEIEGAAITLEPGRKKRFALLIRNDSSEPLYFFAAPHVVHPVEHSLGFRFKCLCINHAFSVGPGEIWYRVVEFRLSKDFVGRELTVTHSIIGIDRERAELFSKAPTLPDF